MPIQEHLITLRSNISGGYRKLDEAVFAAYAWPSGLSDDKSLKKLLA